MEMKEFVSCIMIKKDKLLIVKNNWRNIIGWTLPCGHISTNESKIDAIKREVYEETGLKFKTDPEFEFKLEVFKPRERITNYIYFSNDFEGELTCINDPDKIVVDNKFLKFEDAILKICHLDVRYALKKWRKQQIYNKTLQFHFKNSSE